MGLTHHDLDEWPVTHDVDGRVTAWRTERFLALGYTIDDAIELAESRIDLHEISRLIARGCPLATAARILA